MSKQELSYSYNPESFLRVGQVGFGSQPALTEHGIFARHWWLRVFDSAPPPHPLPKKEVTARAKPLWPMNYRGPRDTCLPFFGTICTDLSRLIKVTFVQFSNYLNVFWARIPVGKCFMVSDLLPHPWGGGALECCVQHFCLFSYLRNSETKRLAFRSVFNAEVMKAIMPWEFKFCMLIL